MPAGDIASIDVDFKVHDAYVAFSAEVVRLALLSPALFAFFLALAGDDATVEAFQTLVAPASWRLVAGVFCMMLAVLSGLIHRYVAADYMTTLIEERRSTSKASVWRLKIATVSILLAPGFLFLGACCLVWAFLGIVIA